VRTKLDDNQSNRQASLLARLGHDVDEGDDLSDAQRQALHEALTQSWASATEGRVRPAGDVLDDLRPGR
jgi:hypothetical protein